MNDDSQIFRLLDRLTITNTHPTSMSDRTMHKVALVTYYYDSPGYRETRSPCGKPISGLSFDSESTRDEAMQILAANGFLCDEWGTSSQKVGAL